MRWEQGEEIFDFRVMIPLMVTLLPWTLKGTLKIISENLRSVFDRGSPETQYSFTKGLVGLGLDSAI